MHCWFYLRKGVAYVPTIAKTEAGYWLAVEPVDVQRVDSVSALRELLLAAIARGNPVVQTPTRQNFPRNVMESYCGIKSLSAFERTATCWSISRNADSCRVYEWRRSARYRGAWEEARDQAIYLPADTPIEEVVQRAAELAMSDGSSG